MYKKFTVRLSAIYSLLLLFAFSFVDQAVALEPDIVQKLKQATVFIHTGKSTGSGFLVERSGKKGLIVTNQHVVNQVSADSTLQVVFNSGQSDQRIMRGKVGVAIASLDLALIHVEADNLPEPISFVKRSPVYETESIYAIGFPFGGQLATNRETPRVTITAGTITSLRSDINDQIKYIQTDAAINPGNSGGPVVDKNGILVGITVAKLGDTDIGFIIPRHQLQELLTGLVYDIDLEVERKWLDSEKWVYEISASGKYYSPIAKKTKIGLRIISADQKPIKEAQKTDQSWNAIKAVRSFKIEINKRSSKGKKSSTVEVPSTYANTKLAVQPYHTIGLLMSYQAPLWLILEPDGEKTYSLVGLYRTQNKRSPQEPPVETSPADPEQKGEIAKQPPKKRRKAKPPKNDFETIALPGVIDSLSLAGNCEFLAFSVDAENGVVLLDLKKQKLLPIDIQLSEISLVTGDSKYVYIGGVETGQLYKWSLQENRIVKKGFSPDGSVSAMAAGCSDTSETLFLISQNDLWILNTKSFAPVNIKWFSANYNRERKPVIGREESYRARAAGNGKLFTYWGTRHSPAGVNVLKIRGDKIAHYNDHTTAGFVVPGHSGKKIYTSLRGAYTERLDKYPLQQGKGTQLIPSIQGNYYLEASYQKRTQVKLVRVTDGTIVTIIQLPEIKAGKHPYSFHRNRPTGDQRLWFDEKSKKLFVIPDSNDRILVRNVDVDL